MQVKNKNTSRSRHPKNVHFSGIPESGQVNFQKRSYCLAYLPCCKIHLLVDTIIRSINTAFLQ